EHIAEYLALDPEGLQRQNNYRVLLQRGDEVLDYRAAQKRYAGCSIVLEDGGDHSFVHYEQHLAAIHQFLISN
ncbi:MAG: YqiA/YcfP family alpha/beta fold hydrolase, partial [Porticoccaceae bacterium]